MTLNWVNELVSNMGRKAKNLITSQPELDIQNIFVVLDQESIDVGEATANQDIIKYLKCQMELKFNKYDENIRKEIESGLKGWVEGSYVSP